MEEVAKKSVSVTKFLNRTALKVVPEESYLDKDKHLQLGHLTMQILTTICSKINGCKLLQ